MAKKGTSVVSDPTEAALEAAKHAIESANGHATQAQDGQSAPRRQGKHETVPKSAAAVDEKPLAQASPQEMPAPGDTDAFYYELADELAAPDAVEAANDDRSAMGKLIYNLQRPASLTPYIFAAIAALTWIVAAFVLDATLMDGALAKTLSLQAGPSAQNIAAPYVATLLTVVVIPVVLFFVVAALFRRMQEIRNVSRAMTDIAIRLVAPGDAAKRNLASSPQAVRGELENLGTSIERALARAGEYEIQIHNEVALLDRAYEENDYRIRRLIQDLADEREAVVSNGERLHHAISGAYQMLANELSSTSERIDSEIRDAHTRIKKSVDTGATDISAGLTAQSATLLKGLREQGRTVARQIGAEVERIFERIDAKNTELSTSFSETSNQSMHSLIDAGAQLISELSDRSEKLNNELNSAGQTLLDDVIARADTLTDKLEAQTERMHDLIAIKGEELDKRLESSAERLGDLLSERAGKVNQSIEANASAIVASVTQKCQGLAAQLAEQNNTVVKQMEDLGANLGQHIDARTRAAVDLVQHRLSGAIGQFEEQAAKASTHFEEKATQLSKGFSQNASTAGQRFNDVAARFNEQMTAQADVLADAFDDRLKRFDKLVNNKAVGLVTDLGDRAEYMNTMLSQHFTTFGSLLDSKAGQIDESLSKYRSTLKQGLTVNVDKLEKLLQTQRHTFEGGISHRLEAMSDVFAEKLQNADSIFYGRLNLLEEALEKHTRSAKDLFAQHTLNLTDVFSSGHDRLQASLHTVLDTSGEALNAQVDTISSNLAGRMNAAKSAFDDRINAWVDTLDKRSEDIGTAIAEKATGVADRIAFESDKAMVLFRRATDDLQGQQNEIISGLDGQLGELAKLLNKQGPDLIEALQIRSDEVSYRIDEAGKTILSAIDSQRQELAQVLHKTGIETVKALRDTKTQVTSELAEVMGQVDNSARALSSLIDHAGESLEQIEATLDQKSEAFRDVVNNALKDSSNTSALMSEQVSLLRSISGKVLEDLSTTTEQFEAQSQALVATAHQLDRANADFEESLDKRGTAIEDMTTSLDHKAREIADLMGEFSSAFNTALESADTQTRDVALSLRNEAENAASVIISRLEDVQRASGLQSQKALSHIRDMHAELSRELGTTITDSSDRLSETITTLREISRELRRDISATRSEMRREIMELPEETKASTEALRRAVTDQIQALKDLSTMVNQREFTDFSPPAQNQATRQSARQRSSSVSARPFKAITENPPSTRPQEAARADANRTTTADAARQRSQVTRSASRLKTSTSSFASPSGATVPDASEQQPGGTNGFTIQDKDTKDTQDAQARGERGWVSNLLSRASDETSTQEVSDTKVRPTDRTAQDNKTLGSKTLVDAYSDDDAPKRQKSAPRANHKSPETEWTQGAPSPSRPRAARSKTVEPFATDKLSSSSSREPDRAASKTNGETMVAQERATGDDNTRKAEISTLESLANCITQALDHKTTRDTWRRYGDGERDNIFTDALYTPFGRRIFKQVQNRYSNDATFKRSVDYYVADFERLLAQVAEADGDSSDVENYLISDMGKVYTLLAHVSHRLQ